MPVQHHPLQSISKGDRFSPFVTIFNCGKMSLTPQAIQAENTCIALFRNVGISDPHPWGKNVDQYPQGS